MIFFQLRLPTFFMFVAIVTLIPPASFAQYNTAEISGVVADTQGAVVPGGSVVAVNTASGLRVERVTDAEGRYYIPALPVGEYTISVSLPGFKQFIQRGLVLTVGEKLNFPVTLDVGPITETVTISEEAPLLQTADAEVSDVIENRKVVELPLNGRQFLQLSLLSDGVVIPPGGTRGAALEQAGSLPAVLGQRSGHNIYLLDGVKVTDEYFNNLVISPSLDSIQEFKIDKTMYPAEFGGKASALINVVTKSGANAFHGSAFEFVRNDKFDARNYFDDSSKPIPPLRQNQFGGTLGGPIRRDRTFFFASYEGQRIRRSLTQTFSVPPDQLRSGNFAGLALCDPLTRTAAGCTGFPNNQIPANRLDPVAIALLQKVPTATSAGSVQNLLAVDKQDMHMDQASLRIDHAVTAADLLFGRFSSYDVRDVQPFGTSSLNEALVPGFGRSVSTKARNLAAGYTHTFGPRLLNEVRFGYLSASGGQSSPNQGTDFAALSGLQGVTGNPLDTGYPQVGFGGLFSAIGDPTTFVSRRNRSYEIYDNVLVDRGTHHIKFGGYLFRLEFNPVNPQTARGAFTFNGQFSGNAFADFLLGYPSAAQVGIGRADEKGRSTWIHVYGQDDWKVNHNLTINYGLRYEINGQMKDVDNRLSAIDLSVPGGRFVIASDEKGNISPSAQPLLSQIPIPYVTSKDASWTRGLLRPSNLRFAPRFGFVWSLGSTHKTIINGGFGVFLNQWAYSVQQALAQTLPFFFAKSVSAPADALVPPYRTATVLLAPANGTVGGNTMLHDYKTEYAKNVSFGIQRELTPTLEVEANYLGSWIVGADSSTVINVPVPGPGAPGPRRPVPQLSNVTAIRWDGYSIFHAVTFKAGKRLSHGLSASANYMLSKAIDDASDPGATAYEVNLPQDVRNMRAENALASFDHRHRFIGSFSYSLPDLSRGGKGAFSSLARDWRLTGIVTLQSGAPFTVNLGTDRANIGAGPAQRPNATCDPNIGGAHTAQQWFNTNCFSLPEAFTFGNAGRNTVFAPGYSNVDASLQKDFRVAETGRLEFRLEAFNLFNSVNFDVPNRTAFTPNFGRIFSAGPGRQMQLGIKALF
ncbi:MAG TPA: TonB-dependent receptor [Candidatus Nitrosotalea sp.]|nr:TonB-dependent receptor [Candidatus Nitrosotalea sp.]